ncbi:MAG TPA: hypothetical protein VGA29_03250, partial [Ignavibacteriaceae bacterium]
MKKLLYPLVLLTFLNIISGCVSVKEITVYEKSVELKEAFNKNQLFLPVPLTSKVDTILIDEQLKNIKIFFNRDLSYIPYRKENVDEIYTFVKIFFGENFKAYNFSIIT